MIAVVWLIVLQLIIYCAIFTGTVCFAVRGGAINGLYFYPKPVQERAFEIGLSDRETVKKKRKLFMALFYFIMLAALLLIIGLWNRISDFLTAYFQALLFLEVMNWYDGIVIDKIWVGHSRFWIIPRTEDLPYIQTWKQVLKKRLFLSLVWAVGAAAVGGLVVLIF
ncbi:MAG: hypothetical protein ACI4KR_12840 [Ruminiclostridium sp.]